MKRNTLLIAGLVLVACMMTGTMAWADDAPGAKGSAALNTGDLIKVTTSTKIADMEAMKAAHEAKKNAFQAAIKEIRDAKKTANATERDRLRAKLAATVAVNKVINAEARIALQALSKKASLSDEDRAEIEARILAVHRENGAKHAERIRERANAIVERVDTMIDRLRVRADESTNDAEQERLNLAIDKLVEMQVRVQAAIAEIEADQAVIADADVTRAELHALQRHMIELRVLISRLTGGVRVFNERVPARAETEVVRPLLTEEALVAVEAAVVVPTDAEIEVEVQETMVEAPVAAVDPTTTGGDQE